MLTAIATIDAPRDHAIVAFQAEADAAHAFAMNARAESTRRGYASNLRIFTDWCYARGLAPLPAGADTVAMFLASEAKAGCKASTLNCRMAAIAYAHRLRGLEPPTNSELVRTTLAGIRRTIGTAPTRKAAATWQVVSSMIACIDTGTLIGKRDTAILALGLATACRRSELAALTIADLVEVPAGLQVTIRRSKTDQTGEGATIAVPNGTRLRPVEALRVWLDAAGIESGPVFRSIRKGGVVSAEPLSDHSIACIVKARAAAAGFDAVQFSGHSLRAGFATSAAAAGASVWSMQATTRHKSVDVLSGYVRSADAFANYAGAAFV